MHHLAVQTRVTCGGRRAAAGLVRARFPGAGRVALRFGCALAAFALLLPLAASAVPIAGRLGSPSDYVPALTVHAWSKAERRLYSVGTSAGQATYVLDVPPGRYVVFATPADPGAPPLYGAHTRFSLCARDPTGLASGACRDHALVEVEVVKRRVDGVDVTDWYLDDAVIAELDAMMGRSADAADEAPLAAPRFSEYPSVRLASVPRAGELQPDADPRVERDREALLAALAAAPTFAGRFAIVRVPCGPTAGDGATPDAPRCEGAAIVDLPLGRVTYPAPLNPLPAAGPCTERGALQFRRDSRLLTRTAPEADQLVTRYFVWDGETARLRSVATLASDLPERCAPAPVAPAAPAGSTAPAAPAAPTGAAPAEKPADKPTPPVNR